MARVRFEFDGRRLRHNLKNLPAHVDRGIDAAVERAATKGEMYLKNDAPWTDRTGAARSGLHTRVEGKREIIFSHTVDYGIWLEIKNSGKYEVILPTVRKTGNELMRDLNGIFG